VVRVKTRRLAILGSVGVAIGVLGGIYPAWRVTRMKPLKALSGT